jgi:hypothetical protein
MCCVVADFFRWFMMLFEYGLRLATTLAHCADTSKHINLVVCIAVFVSDCNVE